jgi:high-affinity nickel permease
MSWIGIIGLSLALGLRHGLDWDHIAALTDITSGSPGTKKQRIHLSFWYAIGHEVIVFILGVLIILFAWKVPLWVDHTMGKLIGLTLIIMALMLVIGRKNQSSNLPMSRGVSWVRKIGRRDEPFFFTKKNVFTIGLIHGIGVETPTQLLLFTTIAGLTASQFGIAIVLAFSIGLFITHILLALIGVVAADGFSKLAPFRQWMRISAVSFSLILGVSYLWV